MELSILLEYGWVLFVLVLLEGILAADNALVLAALVKPLPEELRRKALFYGLIGAFVLRFLSLFMVSMLSTYWQFQAIGAAYLLYLSANHLLRHYAVENQSAAAMEDEIAQKNFWLTVVKVELADMAFALDAIFAALALAITLPDSNFPPIANMDGAKFAVILLGGLIGIVIMRVAAERFVRLLISHPGLETAAFMIVGWVGVKLTLFTLARPELALIPQAFPASVLWKSLFWLVFILIFAWGYRQKPD